MTSALRAAADVSPYFAVELTADGDGWLPLNALIDDVLDERVATARALLAERAGGPVDERVTASIYFLGVAARLLAPALGAAVLADTVPAFTPVDVYWRRVAGGPMPLAVTSYDTLTATDVHTLADLLHEHVIDTVIAPLAAAVRHQFGVSPHVLWGNVASAAAGAAAMLGTAAAVEVTDALLTRGPLTSMGGYADGRFRRNNCCLFYRIPGAGTCGDCVLRPAPAAPPSWPTRPATARPTARR